MEAKKLADQVVGSAVSVAQSKVGTGTADGVFLAADATTGTNDAMLADKAYELMLPELQAIPAEQLLAITVDIRAVVALIAGVLPALSGLTEDIKKKDPSFDVGKIKKLWPAAQALSYAHARYKSASGRGNLPQELADRAAPLREQLFDDVKTLARRKFIDSTKLEDLRGSNGFKNLAGDLFILGSLLREHWEKIQGNCAVKKEEVDEALRLADEILTAVGLKEHAAVSVEFATDMRLRAYTFLAKTYESIRGVVQYLRWDFGDSDKFAPALLSVRARGKNVEEPEDPPTPPPAAAPAGATAATGTPAAVESPVGAPGKPPLGPSSDPFDS